MRREPLQAALVDKEFKGDGESEHEVLTNLQPQAEEPEGDDVVQREVLIKLRSQAKVVDTVEGEMKASGSARPCCQREPLQAAPFDG